MNKKRKNKILIILKGVLFWMTALSIILFIIGGFESLIEQHNHIIAWLWLSINVILYIVCKTIISIKDFYKISGIILFNKIF